MSFSHDRRGQSVVVGTVILFGFLILALSLYQVQFVPAENSEVEFEHSQQVEGDFLDLRNALLSGGTTGEARSTSTRLGTRYPQRTFFLNPPPASGSLETTEAASFEVDAAVGDGVHDNVEAFWDTDPTFETRSIRYTSNYNEYRGAPELVYENSLVAAEFGDRVLPRSEQTIVRGERISLTAISGTISETGVETRSVDSETVSRGSRTIPITGNGEDITISVPTAVSNATDLVDRLDRDEFTGNGDRIEITLDGDETYQLALAEVSVDGSGDTEAAYIVPVGGTEVAEGQSVGVEVRDKYNNPVEAVEVDISDGENRVTNDDGRVFYTPETDGSTAAIDGQSGPEYESVTFEFSSTAGGGEQAFTTQWDDAAEIARGQSGVGADGEGGLEVNREATNEFDVSGSVTADGETVSGISVGFGTGDPDIVDVASEAGDRTGSDGKIEEKSVSVGSTGTTRLFISAGDSVDDILVEVVEDPEDASNFEVTIENTNSPVEEGDDLEVAATIENTGIAADIQTIELAIDGNEVDSVELELESGESETVDLEWDEAGPPGEYTATVSSEDDTDETTVNVIEEGSAFFDVSITDINDPVTEGEELVVDFEVENLGEEEGTQDIVFNVGGEQEDVLADTTIADGEIFSETFTYLTEQGDSPSVEVEVASDDDEVSRVAEVTERTIFDDLSASSTTRGGSSNIESVTFEWTTTGNVDTTVFETRQTNGDLVDSATPDPPFEGQVDVDGDNNDTLELIAITEGEGGSETCSVTITGSSTVEKPDFDCTTD